MKLCDRYSILLLATTAIWSASGGLLPAQEKMPREIFEKLKASGPVLVLVGLKVSWQPEGKLSPEEVLAQRQMITSAQKSLLGELAGKAYKVTRLYSTIPGIALEVGEEALLELERSPNVVNIVEDRPATSSPEQGVPW